MELKNFIKEALKDVMDGVKEAQSEIKHGEIIPPINEETLQNVSSGFTSYQTIDFEVSVTTVEKEGSEAKLSVVAAVIGGHVKGDSSNTSGHVAKLGFKVPIRFSKKQV
ncbi:hypothetical protein N9818_00165 [Arcobacteraceae bacterium]|nr:hypothetical protein [Arcobacteraceae bacterium]